MKHRWNKALALLLALTLAVITIALAEENAAPGDVNGESFVENGQGVESANLEPEVEEVGEVALGDPADAPAETGLTAEDADWNGVQTWWFIVGEEAVAIQEVREGDEILMPDDPAAPEGMAFAGWYLEDGAKLFADGEPVLAHPDALTPEVNVLAAFVEVEEPTEVDPQPSPAEEEAAADPQPSPSGEGGASAPDEVPSPEDGSTSTEGEAADVLAPTPNALTYTGEAQALVTARPGAYLYSLDGENYNEEIPSAVNAGEYTVYFVPANDAEAEPQTLTVTVAKADVVFTPPVAVTEG